MQRRTRMSREAIAEQQKADKLRDAQVETTLRDDGEARALVEECKKWIPEAVVTSVRKLGR